MEEEDTVTNCTNAFAIAEVRRDDCAADVVVDTGHRQNGDKVDEMQKVI